MGTIIAVDIGGTHLRAAAYESDNLQPIQHQRVKTNANQAGVYERLIEVIETVWPKDGIVDAIGAASPGPLDPHTGYILGTPNIQEWQNFPLAPKLLDYFKTPVFLDNDANLAGLGEWKFGAGKGHHDVLYLTVSTGIGGGVIIEDRLLQGTHGLAAELGHVIIDPNGPVCSCGFNGHLEAFSSGPAIVRYALGELESGTRSSLKHDVNLTARQVAEAAMQGDALAISAYQRAGEYLGIGVASFLHTFDPSIVIFGGGVSRVGPLLFDSFHISLRKHVFHPRYLEGLKIEMAALGDDAGLLGALALAQVNLQSLKKENV
ncbi:MAG: ROK family protein [Chloroflexi bacterium]|nr:ROK family protein [Chloroflexota bacterium]